MSAVRTRILPALLCLSLGTALGGTNALARDTDKSWEVGGFVMFSRYASGTGMDGGTGFGARGGYHFKALSELELTIDTASADAKSAPGVSFDITKISVDYLHMFTLKGHEKILPFASFGVGKIDVDDGNENNRSTAWRGGGGFKYWFKPRIGMRFDVKVYHWHGHGDIIPRDPYFTADVQLAATFLLGGAQQ